MSITDELRDYIAEQQWCAKGTLSAIADNIDAAHRSALEKLAAQVDESEDGWIRLPVDADGVPIHVGDVVAATLAHVGSGRWSVDRMELTRAYDQDLWQIALDKDGACWVTPSTVRHHRTPTVEDVLDELFGKANLPDGTQTRAEIIAEYAAKLRLAGEDR